jgi:predicted metal-binding protein
VVQEFQQLIEEYALHDRIDLKATFCMRQCQKKGVAVSVGGEAFEVVPETARTFFAETVMSRIA